ncbi:MAG: glycosyl hydrolase family 28-related protein [Phycisphaerae bacterium]|jgi:hypothetical protein
MFSKHLKFYILLVITVFLYTEVHASDYAYFNVRDYGAAGDGIADDTSAIQAAINAVSAAGTGVVFVPYGTYRITSTLQLKARVSLLGDSQGSVGGSIIKAGGNLSAMIQTLQDQGSYLAIDDLTFDGSANQGYSVTWALDLADFLASRIGSVKIFNINGGGIWSRSSGTGPSWVNWFIDSEIYITGNNYALRLGSSDSFIKGLYVNGGLGLYEDENSGNVYRDCIVENCVYGLIVQTPGGSNNFISVVNSRFRNNTYGVYFNYTSAFQTYATIQNCEFENNSSADVYLKNANHISLVENKFKTANPSLGQNIYMTGDVDYISAVDNWFAGSSQAMTGSNSCSVNNKFSVAMWPPLFEAESRNFVDPLNPNVINVKDYGTVGNGTHDDAPNIQNAINAAQPGDVVYFPKGKYAIYSTINLTKSGITLLGDGKSLNYHTRIQVRANLTSMFNTPSAVSDVTIANMCLYGTSSTGPYTVGCALYLDKATNFVIDRVNINTVTGDGIYLGGDNNLIANCILGADGWQVIITGTGNIINSSYVACGDDGSGVQISGPGGNQILNTHIDRSYEAGIRFVNPSSNPASTLIYNCYMDINKIAIDFDYAATQNANVQIKACVFRTNPTTINIKNAHGITIEGCTSAQGTVPVFLMTSGNVDYLIFSANQFLGSVYVPGSHSVVRGNGGYVTGGLGSITVPAAPTNLNADVNDGTVVLDWNDNQEIYLSHYNVYRALSSGGPYMWIATDVADSAYIDYDTDGEICYYAVTAVDETNNESNYSQEIMVDCNPNADFNGDGIVDFEDFATLAIQWHQLPGVPSADITPANGGDNFVDMLDLKVLAEQWLQP